LLGWLLSFQSPSIGQKQLAWQLGNQPNKTNKPHSRGGGLWGLLYATD
jgi:hypothetical protein